MHETAIETLTIGLAMLLIVVGLVVDFLRH